MNRTAALFSIYCLLNRNMMLTASVAAASMSESFSYRLMHITPLLSREKTSFFQPLVSIIAHSFAGEKRKNGADIRLLSFYVLILLATFTRVFYN